MAETEQTPERPTASRPGAMTMAMQAVQAQPAAGPKVLRIGLIQNGKIVEERILRKRETVSVGSSEKNHFVVHTEGMPARFDLFQLVGSDYILNFTDKMGGRVGLPGGVQDLAQMRQTGAARNAGTHWQVKLSDNSRGKVVLGPTTLLFQFVAPLAVQPRPQLPAAARAGLVRSVDWMFTAFVVFAFMTMFGFVVYLENADWPLAEGLASVPDDVARLIFVEPPPPPEEVEPEAESEEEGEEAEAPSKAPAQEGKQEEGPKNEAAVAEKTARIAEEAAQAAEALIVGALSAEAGGALADVLAGGAVTGNAEDILAQAAGVGVAQSTTGGTLRTRSGGGSGSGVQGLGGLARRGEGTTDAAGEGGAVAERKIRGSAKLEGGGDVGGSGDFDASIVVSQIRARIKAIQACYEKELRRNPTLSGKVTTEFTIEQRGNVSGVKITANTTGDDAVAKCVANTISRFRFNPGPEGGSVTFSYPFVFAPQN